ncbi:MAG: hypothetical protein U5K77_00990 [Candidatus Saccharibacteria bacterium]|nr:hypothetical protein [Candidatus Saccharibacteria bacterium]
MAVTGDGTNHVMTSSDGVSWVTQTAVVDNDWQSVTYGDGLFVAVAGNGGSSESSDRVMTSTDGVTWFANTPDSKLDAWDNVAYGNGTFIAIAAKSIVMTSPDGLTLDSIFRC